MNLIYFKKGRKNYLLLYEYDVLYDFRFNNIGSKRYVYAELFVCENFKVKRIYNVWNEIDLHTDLIYEKHFRMYNLGDILFKKIIFIRSDKTYTHNLDLYLDRIGGLYFEL